MCRIRVKEVQENADFTPTGKVLQIIPPNTMIPELWEQHIQNCKPSVRALYYERGRWIKAGLDVKPYLEMGFQDADRLEQLRIALQMKLSVKGYADPSLRLGQIKRRRRAQLRHFAAQFGLLPDGCNKEQIDEILTGLEHQVDTAIYANTKYSARVMREMRLALEAGWSDRRQLRRLGYKGVAAVRQAREAAASAGTTPTEKNNF